MRVTVQVEVHKHIIQYLVPYQGCFIRKYKAAIWTITVTKTCMISGIMLLPDIKLPIGRSATSLDAGPVRPITTAMLVVITRSMYRNWMFPRMLAHLKENRHC
jgi:hypothetical protein